MKASNRIWSTFAQGGFTLVEVMVAALLLLVVLLPMLAMFSASVTVAVKSETENTAALLAQEQIEEIRALNYDSMVLNASRIDAQSGFLDAAAPYRFVYNDATYTAVAEVPELGGVIVPVSTNVERRKAFYAIKRYILWDPVGGNLKDHKKIVVVVSWTKPQPGSMTFEANAVKAGNSTSRPPVVVGTFPYIGDAFHSSDEIITATATASDPDGTVSNVQFQYKKNIEATFSNVGFPTGPITPGSGFDFFVSWSTTLGATAQYNLRVIATDNTGLTGTETHPFFIDGDAPPPPDSIAVTGADASTAPMLWPLHVTWPAVHDYIDGNTNFNMVIGYLVYRDERATDSPTSPVSSALIATLYGSEVTVFYDATSLKDGTGQVRYRLKSMGRAKYWRDNADAILSSPDPVWFPVGLPTVSEHVFPDFTTVVASPASWSAISLAWPSQQDANLYLVYRTPGWQGSARSLVGTVADPDPVTPNEITYRDENLTRNTTYQYFVVPVVTSEYPPGTGEGTSNAQPTSLY